MVRQLNFMGQDENEDHGSAPFHGSSYEWEKVEKM